jgi:hypothetical protein
MKYVLWQLKKLTDQITLFDIAKNDKSTYIWSTAMTKITDQRMLFDIAINENNTDVRLGAVLGLSDQQLLADIAKNANETVVSLLAVDRLTDQVLLADIAKNGNNSEVRSKAANRLLDQDIEESKINTENPQSANNSIAPLEVNHGGFNEPYCSSACYDNGGRYASAVMLKNQSGVCGFCQKPVRASMYGALECSAIPYEDMTLFICLSCSEKAKAHLKNYRKCCMCQRDI